MRSYIWIYLLAVVLAQPPEPPRRINAEQLVLSEKALRCLCMEATECINVPCTNTSTTCGMYMLSKDYWTRCYQPSGNFERCMKDKLCTEECILSYIYRHVSCLGDAFPRDENLISIHYGGFRGCTLLDPDTQAKVAKVMDKCCLSGEGECSTHNKVSAPSVYFQGTTDEASLWSLFTFLFTPT